MTINNTEQTIPIVQYTEYILALLFLYLYKETIISAPTMQKNTKTRTLNKDHHPSLCFFDCSCSFSSSVFIGYISFRI